MDDLADDEDDTTSSDDLEDDDGADMFQLQDTPAAVEAPPTPDIADVPDMTYSDVETVPAESMETPNTLTRSDAQIETSSMHDSASRTSSRPSRMIVGRLIPAPRPGTSQQGTRVAFIDTSGRPVYSGRTSTGSVSPTSRAYIQAALHSPTGPVHIDIPDGGEDDPDVEVSDIGAPTHHLTHSPQYQQMVAAGQSIHPSESSTQIDNLIETMQQAQRAARVPSPVEHGSTFTETGSSNISASHQDTDENL